MLTYRYTSTPEAESLVIVTPTGPLTLTGSHPNFATVRTYLRDALHPDEAHVRRLVEFATPATERMEALSERVAYRHGTLYFDGDRIDTALTRHIVRMIRNDDADYARFVRFLENLALNPSPTSRRHLFHWLQGRDLSITKDGHFIGYKGVTNDDRSLHAGHAVVNGQPVHGRVPNPVGGVIEMPRTSVNTSREHGCSTGLHVGTWDYARGFGAKVLTVAVNPRDVVSVPRDCDSQKLRCCRYSVLDVAAAHGDTFAEPFTGTSFYDGDGPTGEFVFYPVA